MLDREDFKLRNVKVEESVLLFNWRNSERIRSVSLNKKEISQVEHEVWFSKMIDSSPPLLQIFEYNSRPAGIVQVKPKTNEQAFWSFYIGATDLPKGSGSALGYLGLNWGFKTYRSREILGEVLIENKVSVSFHKKFGFLAVESRDNGVGRFALTFERWNLIKSQIEKKVFK